MRRLYGDYQFKNIEILIWKTSKVNMYRKGSIYTQCFDSICLLYCFLFVPLYGKRVNIEISRLGILEVCFYWIYEFVQFKRSMNLSSFVIYSFPCLNEGYHSRLLDPQIKSFLSTLIKDNKNTVNKKI